VNNACVSAGRVFVTDSFQSANLGGPTGADKICQMAANAQTLGGMWRAWISTPAASASARLTHATVPYRLLDGTKVANNWTDLTDGSLAHAIDLSEQGNTLTGGEVWTSTNSNGTAATPNGCKGFTSNAGGAPYAEVGLLSSKTGTWTHVYQQFCNRTNVRLYCFEQ